MDENMRILKMLEEGKITAEQAQDLLSAMGHEQQLPAEVTDISESEYNKKMFWIQVESMNKDTVNVKLPIKAIKKILKITGKIPVPKEEMQGFDMEELTNAIIECLDSQVVGDIVNVTSSDGSKVRVYIS